jgi:hypothetical protein
VGGFHQLVASGGNSAPVCACPEFLVHQLRRSTYIWQNDRVTSGLTLDNIGWAFRSGYALNWHPLTWMSHMLDCETLGVNAGAMHVVNALLHAGMLRCCSSFSLE